MFISVTRLRVRLLRYLPGFILYASVSARQARRASGNVGVGLLRDANNAFWTRTAWRDEASMRAFMMAKPHRLAMDKLILWCDEAHVVHWSQETPDLPRWHDAHQRMVRDGRRSKVKYPSAAHEAFEIPPPNVPAQE
jgi:hypothetical protein